MTVDNESDPELDQYMRAWPGNAHTEAVAAGTQAEPPPVAETVIEEAPVSKAENETPKDFLHTFSAAWAEEKVLELLTAAHEAPEQRRADIFTLAQVFATLSVARSIREQTASQSQPPKAWRMNQETGKIEEL